MSNTPTPEVLKERALFYLDRRLRSLQEVTVDHVKAAGLGTSYEARRDAERQLETQNQQNAHEREALQWLRDQVAEKL